jgi:hypothetical protein
MINFKVFLREQLNKTQKTMVDRYVRHITKLGNNLNDIHKFSDHVIPPGESRITIPLERTNNEAYKVHPEVEQHLNDNGYKVEDHKEGLASDQYGRSTKIGKILRKTKASKNVVDKFINDPERSGKRKSNLQVVISRHPHDVAAMSTNRGWSSCLSLTGKKRVHAVKGEIAAGTHVAYLTHANDPEITNPIARIALRPFYHKNDHNKTILRPELNIYGTAHKDFQRTVSKWTNKHFPIRTNDEYNIDDRVYNDSLPSTIKSFNRSINSKDPDDWGNAIRLHPDRITSSHIDKVMAIKDPDYNNVKINALKHPKATKKHVGQAIKDFDEEVVRTALEHPKADASHISQVLNSSVTSDLKTQALYHPKATNAHVEQAMGDKDVDLRMHAMEHPKATREQLIRGTQDEHKWVREAAQDRLKRFKDDKKTNRNI